MEKMMKTRILIISLISVLIIGIIFFIVFSMLKGKNGSNKEQFYKYMEQADLKGFLKIKSQDDYISKLSSEKQKSEGSLRVKIGSESDEQYDFESQSDPQNKYSNFNLKINQNNKEKLKAAFTKNDELYGLTCIYNQIMVVKKDDTLEDLLQKMGMYDAMEMQDSSVKTVINELKENSSKYISIIKDTIPDTNYTKLKKETITINGQQTTANGYSVSITSNEINSIAEKCLEITNNESLKNYFTSIKKQAESNSNIKLNISVYEQNKKIVKLYAKLDSSEENEQSYIDFSYENNEKIVINYVINNSLDASTGALEGDENYTIEIIKNNSNGQDTYNIKLKQNTNDQQIEVLNIEIYISGLDTQNVKYTIAALAKSMDEELKIEFSINTEFGAEFEQEKITDKKHIILNDLPEEKIKILMNNLEKKVNEKIDLNNSFLGLFYSSLQPAKNDAISNAANQANSQAKEMFNSQFSVFEGEQKGASVKALISKIELSNSSMDNKVEYNNNMEIDTSKTYNISFETDEEGYINKVNIEE